MEIKTQEVMWEGGIKGESLACRGGISEPVRLCRHFDDYIQTLIADMIVMSEMHREFLIYLEKVFMRLLAIVVASLLISYTISISGTHELLGKLQNRTDIAKVVLSRLEQETKEQETKYKCVNYEYNIIDISKIRESYHKWLETKDESSWKEFMLCADKMAKRFGGGLLVEIKTFRNRIEQSGATIKYQLTESSEIKTAQRLSPATEFILPIGIYYVWSERDGRITSDKNSYTLVVGEKASLEINEYR